MYRYVHISYFIHDPCFWISGSCSDFEEEAYFLVKILPSLIEGTRPKGSNLEKIGAIILLLGELLRTIIDINIVISVIGEINMYLLVPLSILQ